MTSSTSEDIIKVLTTLALIAGGIFLSERLNMGGAGYILVFTGICSFVNFARAKK